MSKKDVNMIRINGKTIRVGDFATLNYNSFCDRERSDYGYEKIREMSETPNEILGIHLSYGDEIYFKLKYRNEIEPWHIEKLTFLKDYHILKCFDFIDKFSKKIKTKRCKT